MSARGPEGAKRSALARLVASPIDAIDHAKWTVRESLDLARYLVGPRFREDVRMDVGHSVAVLGLSPRRALALSLWSQALFVARASRCCVAGHALVGASAIGPDSAHEVVSCARCGKVVLDHYYY